MTRIEFDDLVAQLENNYRGRHKSLARRALGLAFLGYLGLAFFLVIAVGLVGGSLAMVLLRPGVVTIKLGLLFGVPSAYFSFAVIKGLWVRTQPPEGLRLHPHECPELFEVIDEIGAQAGGVRFEEILLVDELNASVVQIPRLGVFGWFKPYLILGLPLMDALTEEEFRSVVAHEFAHLSHQHGRLGIWLYRVRASWARVVAAMESQGLPRPIAAFISWFWPRFNSSAFVLSRAQEYQADAFAASVTSPQSAGRALQSLAIQSRRLEESFWSEIQKSVRQVPEPPQDLYHRMQHFLSHADAHEPLDRWLQNALSIGTGTDDTHPGLRDRLAALGVTSATSLEPPTASTMASNRLLDEKISRAARERFNQVWLSLTSAQWKLEHEHQKEIREQLESHTDSEDPVQSCWDKLVLRARLDGPDSIQNELINFLGEHPDHSLANFFRGVNLAEKDDLSAIPFLEKASVSPELCLSSLDQMAGLYNRLNLPDQVRAMKQRADEFDRIKSVADSERNHLHNNDRFLPHGLPPEAVGKLVSTVLRTLQPSRCTLKKAWLVRKEVQQFRERPHYVLVVDLKWPFFSLVGDSEQFKLLHQLINEIEIEGSLLGLIKAQEKSGIAKKITKIPDSELKIS